MKDFLKEILNGMLERSKGVMYGYFFISWLVWNWKLLYFLFFTDEQIFYNVTGQLKFQYIEDYYSVWHLLIFGLILPGVSTYLIIYQFSKIDFKVYKKHWENNYARKIEKETQRQDYLVTLKATIDQESNVLKAEVENKKLEINLQKNPDEVKWGQDFQERIQDDFFIKALEELKKSIYEYKGKIQESDRRNLRIIWTMPKPVVTFLDLNELVKLNGDNIQLTSKGKYYLKMYLDYKSYE